MTHPSSEELFDAIGRDDREDGASPPPGRTRSRRPRARRRTALITAAAVAALIAGTLTVSHFTTGSATRGRTVSANPVESAAGHRPLVPDFTASSLTGTPVKLTSYLGKILVLN